MVRFLGKSLREKVRQQNEGRQVHRGCSWEAACSSSLQDTLTSFSSSLLAPRLSAPSPLAPPHLDPYPCVPFLGQSAKTKRLRGKISCHGHASTRFFPPFFFLPFFPLSLYRSSLLRGRDERRGRVWWMLENLYDCYHRINETRLLGHLVPCIYLRVICK